MILITGGTGFIGSHVLDRLAAAGEPVRALVRRKSALPAGVEAAYADLAEDTELSNALRGVTVIIHIAGAVKAVRPADYYRGNVRATENLARAARGRGIRFVHVSSLAACGPCPDMTPLNEECEPAPITHYGKSKLEGEQAARTHLPDAVIVRPPVVYGPRDTGVYSILKSVSQGIMLQIAGGERWFSMVYVDDLVDGLLAAVRTPLAAGRTYFISHPDPLNWSALGAEAARIMGRKPLIVRVPIPAAYAVGCFGETWGRLTRRPGFVTREKITEATRARWVCDSRRASAELGAHLHTSLTAGLTRTLAWYKEAGWLKY
ncbi:MAG: NAD-dependent epimerase/dehydratase family protein [Bryobacteraceae bacterium]|jgi:nucleoside-diphosphate-sugar epimerase